MQSKLYSIITKEELEASWKEEQIEIKQEMKQMETQNELETQIGTEESIKLQPVKVTIESVSIEEFGVKKSKKVVALCNHPHAPDKIKISSVKYENKGKLEVVGLWVNKDKEDKLRKGSALVLFLQNNNCKTIQDLKGKQFETILDDKGYLAFKGY